MSDFCSSSKIFENGGNSVTPPHFDLLPWYEALAFGDGREEILEQDRELNERTANSCRI